MGFSGNETSLTGSFTNIQTFNGSSSGSDSLSGRDEAAIWNLSGSSLSYSALTYENVAIVLSGVEILIGSSKGDTFNLSGTIPYSLVGGSGNDRFIFLDKATVQGSINGKEGQDTLDFSVYRSARSIRLTQAGANGFSGQQAAIWGDFANINTLVGSPAPEADAFTGLNAEALFSLNADQTVSYQNGGYTLTLSSFESLSGGSGDDRFKLYGSQIYTLFGGAGNDTFAFIGSAQLKGTIDGGSGINTFIFKDNWGHDVINPGSGLNILDFSRITADLVIILNSDQLKVVRRELNPEGETIFDSALVSGLNLTRIVQKIYSGQGNDEFLLNVSYSTSLYGGEGDDAFRLANGAVLTGLLDGQSGSNKLDFSAYTTAKVVNLNELGYLSGFSGTEQSISLGFYNISDLIGSSALSDKLTGLKADASFFLNDTDTSNGIISSYQNHSSGRILIFASFETLVGGVQNDRFEIEDEQNYNLFGGAGNDIVIFFDNAKLVGNIDGQSGENTLDFSAYTTSRNFYLNATGTVIGFNGKEASISGQFANINRLLGGKTIDSLTGLNLASTWEISGANTGTYKTGSISLTFASIDTLNGGALNDHFTFSEGASLAGNIDGRSGIDTLDYSSYLSDLYVNLLTGKVAGITGGISSIENVTGGQGDDELIGDDKGNILNGKSGNNTLAGGRGNDTYTFDNDWGQTTIIEDVDGGLDSLDFTATTYELTVILSGSGGLVTANSRSLIYSGNGVENFLGGLGNDVFEFRDNVVIRGSIDGGGGNNALDYRAYQNAISLVLTGYGALTGFRGTESSILGNFVNISALVGTEYADNLSGLNQDSTWEIAEQNKGVYKTGGEDLDFSSIENLTGGKQSDKYTFHKGASLDGRIDGGNGTDTLDYSAWLQGIDANLTTGKVSGVSGIISRLENITGGMGNDRLIGDDNNNILDGGPGDDWLDGRGGDDTLIAGSGFVIQTLY